MVEAMEADPVRDMAHPEGIGVELQEIRHKSCRGMQLMLYVNLAKQTGRAQLSCLPGRYNISIYCTVAYTLSRSERFSWQRRQKHLWIGGILGEESLKGLVILSSNYQSIFSSNLLI